MNWKEFPAVLAHELRNPLAGVAAYMDLLRETLDPLDPRTEYLEAMEVEVRRMERVLSSLVEYSRRGRPRTRALRPGPFLERLVQGFREKARREGVDLVLDLGPALGKASLDPELMERVLGNLLENALRAARGPRGKVVLSARRKDSRLEIRCADNGPGVPPGEKERIFEPFFTKSAKGLGLGLPLARRIVEDHGGTLAVESAPGGGAVFVLELPALEDGERTPSLEVARGAVAAR